MALIENLLISPLIASNPAGGKLFLVGGAVRDILLQRPGKDFDLVCDFDTRIIARAFADSQHGAFYVLDPVRNTSRVLLTLSDGNRVVYDFARMHGDDLATDLKARDFTINAMAIDLHSPDRIIDPLGGAADLKDRVLRVCSESAFLDDPVRVIRAVRYAVNLNLTLTPATLRALKAAVLQVGRTSKERSRDEFLKVFETGKPDVGLQLLGRLGILAAMGFDTAEVDFAQACRHCGALEQLFSELEGIGIKESAQALPLTSFLLRLGRFRDPLLGYLHRQNSSGRTLRTLDVLAGFLGYFSQKGFDQALLQLALSNDEKEHLTTLFDQRGALAKWVSPPDRRQIYKFYKKAPVDLSFLWIAGLLAKSSAERSQQSWLDALEICETLVDAWANQPQILNPLPLLNGKELMIEFDLQPGKRLGEILDGLLEEQAAGTVTTRSEALQWVENHLTPVNLF